MLDEELIRQRLNDIWRESYDLWTEADDPEMAGYEYGRFRLADKLLDELDNGEYDEEHPPGEGNYP